MKAPTPLILCLAFAAEPVPLPAHSPAMDMHDAVSDFLAALEPEQRAEVIIPFESAERRNWHYVPRSRRGLSLKQMSASQREQAHRLVSSILSHDGSDTAWAIVDLERVLAVLEHNPRFRDPELYYLTVFGDPAHEPWGWRFEGHHLSLNFTVANGHAIATTPQFFGANPAMVREGSRAGFRALAAEEDLGRKLVKSLDPGQEKSAVILERAPSDILNVPGRNQTKAEGIAWSALLPAQRETLLALVRTYLDRCRSDVAEEAFSAIEASGLEHLTFAWAGGVEPGQPHYYRVQGPTFVLEYDNTQNHANHVHTVWRDFDGDFGDDLLAAHYATAHQHSGEHVAGAEPPITQPSN